MERFLLKKIKEFNKSFVKPYRKEDKLYINRKLINVIETEAASKNS